MKSIEDVRRLVVATRGLSGLADASTLLVRACRRLHELAGADVVAIALQDSRDTLVVRAAEWPSGNATALLGLRSGAGSGLGGRALERAMPVTTADCGDEPPDDLVSELTARGVRGLAAVPLTFGGTVLGVLYAGSGDRRITPRTTLLMTEFGASLAPLLITSVRAARAGEIAVAQDRQRIAQQLHDTAGQLLFQISMSASEIQQCAAADPDGAVAAARSIETAAARASNHLREAMHSLLPAADALPVTFRRDAATFAERTGIAAEVVVLGTPAHAGGTLETVLVSVLREALHNVEKHAGAGAVLVSLAYQSHQITLAVEDDGKGFPPGFGVNPVVGRSPGLGVPGLLQRVNGAGGTLRLGRNDDGGASLRVSLPLVSPA